MKNIFTIVAFIFFFGINAQNNNLNDIKNTITNYYDGYIHRDLDKLNSAFDMEGGTMKVPVTKNGKITGFKNRYFKELVIKWGNRAKLSPTTLKNCKLEILDIDIVDDKIASSKISMKVDKITYIDILSLHKINDYWKITNKIYAVRKSN